MKVKILEHDFNSAKAAVGQVVEATKRPGNMITVPVAELKRVGANDLTVDEHYIFIEGEYELL